MLVLALDTSSPRASAALVEGTALRAARTAEAARHGQSLEPLLRSVLSDAGAALADVELVAAGLGPGSFTGTRIGVAAAKGLALGRRLPLVGVCSLEVLAAGLEGPGLRAPLVDAGRGRVYGALYQQTGEGLERRLDLFDRSPADALAALEAAAGVEPFRLLGSGVARHEALATAAGVDAAALGERTPSAEALARLALRAFRREPTSEVAAPALEPLYVRPSDATLPATAQRSSKLS